MKVGDLVELSAAGKKVQCNRLFRGKIGLVLEEGNRFNPYKIHWISDSYNLKSWYFKRRELKHFKGKRSENKD